MSRISVLISAYNHEKFIQDTIKSIIAQTHKDIELIIIDDGSTDNTFSKMNEMKEECENRFSNVVFLTQPNTGAAITTNKIIKYAQGDYCFLMASDDVLKPNALETCHHFLSTHEDYLFVVGDNDFIDDQNNPVCIDDKRTYSIAEETSVYKFKTFIAYAQNRLSKSYGKLLEGRYNRAALDYIKYSDLWFDCLTPIGSLIRKTAFENALPYSVNCPQEDMYLLYQLTKNGKIKVLPDVLVSYRLHKNNQMKNTERIRRNCKITNFYEMYLLDTKYPNIDLSNNKQSNWFLSHYNIYQFCKQSKYWDEQYYIEKYPDVLEKGFVPLVHYLSIGVDEGKLPSKFFENKKILKGKNPIMNNIYGIVPKYSYKLWKHLNKYFKKKIVSSQKATRTDKIRYRIYKHLAKNLLKEKEIVLVKNWLSSTPVNDKKSIFIFTAGTSFSGNTATKDFFHNFTETGVCKQELDLFRYQPSHVKNLTSLFNLYDLVKDCQPLNEALIKMNCYWRVLYWHHYQRQMGADFLKYLDEYTETLTTVSNKYLQVLPFIESDEKIRVTAAYEREFLYLSKNLLMNVMDLLEPDKKIKVFSHGIINNLELNEQIKFFDQDRWKLIRTIRDPRDIWTEMQSHPELSWWLPQNVEEFIDFFKERTKFLKLKAANILTVRFEDLCLKYDTTSKKLMNFVGLQNNPASFNYFNPAVSSKNIGIYKTFRNQEDIQKIEEALSEYLYHNDKNSGE